MVDDLYRIHPAIGIARVGNSEAYYLGPETAAGLPLPGQPDNPARGGLPIDPDTDATITSKDLRDAEGGFKRQAARFRIFQYGTGNLGRYPTGQGTEIQIGSTVNGKKVKDIVWTVHVANKKANTYVLVEDPPLAGIVSYENGKLPPIRNKNVENGDPNNPTRITMLTIDPGPRTISGRNAASVKFDKATPASYYKPGSGITQLGNYPKSFPADSFSQLYCPGGPIDTLGELRTDKEGRLLVLGGYGRACGWDVTPPLYGLHGDVNNDNWFDDCSDGPVSAVLVLDDASVQEVQIGAWVVTTDPGYAPQTLNIVSLFDDMYDTWVRKLALAPALYDETKGGFQTSYKPPFPDQLQPIFQSVALQQWNINLNTTGISVHDRVGQIDATTDPSTSIISPITDYVRNPSDPAQWSLGPPLMPGSLGDSNQNFLVVSQTQYFILQQWQNNTFTQGPGPALGPGEYLDKVVLQNCLGGRFSPGIDLTFVVRQPDFYIKEWQAGAGPFRIKPAPLNYGGVSPDQPLLSEGYVPLHTGNSGLEPGDVSKFMAIPWHTDYNSCATHPATANPAAGDTLYWSWPAQRPVAVYPAKLNPSAPPKKQLWSVRGPGTASPLPQNWGRYQQRIDIVLNWPRIGVVLQGSAIDGGSYGASVYLEVASLLEDTGDPVQPYPNTYVSPS